MMRGLIILHFIGVVMLTTSAHATSPGVDACRALIDAHLYQSGNAADTETTTVSSKPKTPKNVQLNLTIKDGKAVFKPKKVAADKRPLPPLEEAFEQGLYFWLVKGVSRLPHPPKKKNVVENGFLDIAVPLTPGDSKSDLVIFHYRALNQQDGTRSAILKSFSLSDSRGRELGRKSATGFLNDLESTSTDQAYAELKIKNQRIPFPLEITEDVFKKYHHFFVAFFYNPSQRDGYLRKLEDLHDVETLAQLERRRRHFHRQNMRRWVMERFARYAVVHLALIASTPLWIDKMPGSQMLFPDPQPVIAESVPPELAQVTGPTSLNFSLDGENVEVFVLKNSEDQFSLLLSPAHWDKIDENNQIQLMDSEGQEHTYFVVTLSDGNKALIRLADPMD